MTDHDCILMDCHNRLDLAEALVKQLRRERDDALSRWYQMDQMQAALRELADKLFPPHDGHELIAHNDGSS